MKTIKCDRCGKEMPYVPSFMNSPKQGIVSISIFTWCCGLEKREVDLCDKCQREVYNYIFDYGNGVGA